MKSRKDARQSPLVLNPKTGRPNLGTRPRCSSGRRSADSCSRPEQDSALAIALCVSLTGQSFTEARSSPRRRLRIADLHGWARQSSEPAPDRRRSEESDHWYHPPSSPETRGAIRLLPCPQGHERLVRTVGNLPATALGDILAAMALAAFVADHGYPGDLAVRRIAVVDKEGICLLSRAPQCSVRKAFRPVHPVLLQRKTNCYKKMRPAAVSRPGN